MERVIGERPIEKTEMEKDKEFVREKSQKRVGKRNEEEERKYKDRERRYSE